MSTVSQSATGKPTLVPTLFHILKDDHESFLSMFMKIRKRFYGDGARHLPKSFAFTWRLLPTLFCLTAGAVMLFEAGSLHGPEASYPAALAVVLMVIATYTLARELPIRRNGASIHLLSSKQSGERDAGTVQERLTIGRPVGVAALLILIFALIPPLGFFTIIPILILGALFVTGVRQPVRLIVGGICIWAACYAIFGLLLNMPLPSGNWW